jgi:hypothetical protein
MLRKIQTALDVLNSLPEAVGKQQELLRVQIELLAQISAQLSDLPQDLRKLDAANSQARAVGHFMQSRVLDD